MEPQGISALVMNGNIEGAIRFFKKKCEASRLPQDMRRHEYYLSRSARRREEDRKAKVRRRKREVRNEFGFGV